MENPKWEGELQVAAVLPRDHGPMRSLAYSQDNSSEAGSVNPEPEPQRPGFRGAGKVKKRKT